MLLAWRSLILAIPRRLFGLSSSSTSYIHEARGLRASDCDDSHPTIGARHWRHPNPSSTPHISDFLDSLESSRWRVARRAQALTQRYGSKGKVSSDPYPTTQRNALASPALGDFTEPQHIAMPSTNPRRHSWAVDEPAKSPPLVLGIPFVSPGLSSLSPPQKLPSIPPRTLSGPLSPPASREKLWGMKRHSSGPDIALESTLSSDDLHPSRAYLVPDPATNSLVFIHPRNFRSRSRSLSLELGTVSP